MTGNLISVSRLQEELKQRIPFQSPMHEALVGLIRTTDVLRRRMTTVVEAQGITLQQYNVLRILRGGGDNGVPTLEVADRMIEETPGITRLLDRLEAKGLVRRQRCPKDRRQHLCWITPEGRAVLDTLDEPLNIAAETAFRKLEEADRVALIRLLDAIRAADE